MTESVGTSSVQPSSKFAMVNDSNMHYLEIGEGRPILFLHGNPTSSYLWRNVIPHVAPHGRCIALDLIGMGRSDKPNIEYRFDDHATYVEGFIDALELTDITLIVHDWGAGLGLDYACRHPENVCALAFMEGVYRPVSWKERPIIERFMFKRMRHPEKGYKMIVENNFFVERVLPMMTVRTLSAEEMAAYREPFSKPEHRRPLQMWPRQIPFDGDPPEVHERIDAANGWLRSADCPKLLLWAKPGGLIRKKDIDWFRSEVPNLEDVCIGKGKHYIQEDQPHAIGKAIAQWIVKGE